MLGVSFAGPRGAPCVIVKGQQYLMEHRVYATPPTPPDGKDFWLFSAGRGAPEQKIIVETDVFWLFGFSPQLIECIYQGPSPLPDSFLAQVVPRLRDAVREELNTGRAQHVDIDKENSCKTQASP